MIDYNFQGRLTYLPGGPLNVQMSAWPVSGFDKTNLISWWSMDETSGTRNDSHGTNHLTDNNTVLYAAGKQGNAADLEYDNGEYLSIANNASLATGDIDFTFACWVKFESLADGRTVAGKWQLVAGGREWTLVYESSNIRFYVSSTGSDTISLSGGAASTGIWYFYVVWHDATANTINIQINNGTPVSASHLSGVYNSGTPLWFGNLITSTGTPLAGYYHDGLIDEASFWKRVLTADERTWLYNGGAGRTYADL